MKLSGAACQKLFGLSIIKSKYELVPLLGVLSLACVGAVGYSTYSLLTKSDVSLSKKERNIPRFENVDPEKSQKLWNTGATRPGRNPELDALRKEIGSYKS